MSDSGRGLPLLSGPPPLYEEQQDACRKCNKEFNVIFNRSRKCNHCGYSYCHGCTDYQALMPRSGVDNGYDAMHVCAFCVEFLTITAAGRTYLKSQPLAKLKKYVNAYNIKINRAVEKDDIIDAILAARNLNGCLPRENENFYRQYSVPNRTAGHRPRGIFTRPNPNDTPPVLPQRPPTQPTYDFPRPDLAPDSPPQHAPHSSPPPPQTYNRPSPIPPRPQYNPPPHPPPRPQPPSHSSGPTSSASHSTHPHHFYRTPPPPPPPPQASRPPPQQSSYQQTNYNYNTSSSAHNNHRSPPHHSFTPAAAPTPPPPPPPPPVPSLDDLLWMTTDSISALSISMLKQVLFTNHVNAAQILEKSDLVKKVLTLVEDERGERERQRLAEEMEEVERHEVERQRQEEREREVKEKAERERMAREGTSSRNSENDGMDDAQDSQQSYNPEVHSSPSPPLRSKSPKVPTMTSHIERTGLCVICQDEEANIAIVDCGHLAMCRGCSDMVMSSSRECPLCRTRIVTEARLLRIYKT